MSSIAGFMQDDHDRLDKIFREFSRMKNKELKKAKPLFHDFKIGLQRHIVWEEEILFPLFEGRTGMHDAGPTFVMRMEHRQIKGFLEGIHDKIAESEVAGLDELENGLLEVLTAHNEKEENILYPWIDNSLNEEEKGNALFQMKNMSPDKYNKCCGG